MSKTQTTISDKEPQAGKTAMVDKDEKSNDIIKKVKDKPSEKSPEEKVAEQSVEETTEEKNNKDRENEEIKSSEQIIEELKKELADKQDQYLRTLADFDNYRKRSYKELTSARREACIATVMPFLQVFDHFDLAVSAAESADNSKAVKEGMRMILGEFKKALDELGIKRFDGTGQDFDPHWHDAVAKEPSDDIPEGKIIKQWRCGYLMGDRLVRTANVVVSSGSEKKEEKENKE